jgi:hypothetical protein
MGNNQSNMIMSMIDRIFCTTSFGDLFPLGNAKALPRLGSDHAPIIWDSGEATSPKKSSFKFKNGGVLDLILWRWCQKLGIFK